MAGEERAPFLPPVALILLPHFGAGILFPAFLPALLLGPPRSRGWPQGKMGKRPGEERRNLAGAMVGMLG